MFQEQHTILKLDPSGPVVEQPNGFIRMSFSEDTSHWVLNHKLKASEPEWTPVIRFRDSPEKLENFQPCVDILQEGGDARMLHFKELPQVFRKVSHTSKKTVTTYDPNTLVIKQMSGQNKMANTHQYRFHTPLMVVTSTDMLTKSTKFITSLKKMR